MRRNLRPSASFWESGRIAIQSLSKNKLRSFLTLLGIILATATLIAVTSFVHGMDVYIATKLSDMGSNGFRVVRIAFIGNWDPKKFLEMQRRNPPIKPVEYEFIRQHATTLKDVGLETWKSVTLVRKGQSFAGVDLEGITANIPDLSDIEAGVGRLITPEEVRRHAPVAFIGSDVSQHYFSGEDPIGKTIGVDGVPYEIVGVAKAKGSVFGQSQDKFVMVPVYSYLKTYGLHGEVQMHASAIDPSHLSESEDEVRSLLRAFRHLRPGEDDTFTIFASDTISKAWTNLTGAIAATAIGIVSVFLVVGGIVIMNIMLAVVTERTHEIGIRKSLGARRTDILNQFLVESAVLSLAGGMLGVIIAYLLTVLVNAATPLPMEMPASSVVIGVGLSIVVGLFFGIYPARQASKLDPIVALHAE
ncbi:MAG TPA: ABC transporter permease [Candidatus Binataceae bacterium]|nr:ABC transporter permease [Candidatus Binataceae bacterium]